MMCFSPRPTIAPARSMSTRYPPLSRSTLRSQNANTSSTSAARKFITSGAAATTMVVSSYRRIYLFLYAAEGEPAHEESLGNEHEHQDGREHHHAGRGHRAPVDAKLT